MSQQLLGAKEVAYLLGVSQKTVLREIFRGKMAAVKVGRIWRVSPSALCEYFKCTDDRLRQCRMGGNGMECYLRRLL